MSLDSFRSFDYSANLRKLKKKKNFLEDLWKKEVVMNKRIRENKKTADSIAWNFTISARDNFTISSLFAFFFLQIIRRTWREEE